MKFVRGKYALVTAATLVLAGGAGALLVDAPKERGWNPNILSMLHARSPGERAEGALLVKKGEAKLPVAAAAPARKAPVVSAVLPAAPSALAPIATAATPVPALIPAVAPAAAPAVVAAAAPAASSFFLPPVFIPGSSSHTVQTTVTPPPPGGSQPPPVPGVPEPETWLMMIVGFAFLGTYLRRRRAEPILHVGVSTSHP